MPIGRFHALPLELMSAALLNVIPRSPALKAVWQLQDSITALCYTDRLAMYCHSQMSCSLQALFLFLNDNGTVNSEIHLQQDFCQCKIGHSKT